MKRQTIGLVAQAAMIAPHVTEADICQFLPTGKPTMSEGPYISYGELDDEFGRALFRRICPVCGRFVKADKTTTFRHPCGHSREDKPNATCAVHGRVTMPFEGYYD